MKFSGLIKEAQLYHYLKNCQESIDNPPRLTNNKNTRETYRSARDNNVINSNSIIIPQNSILKQISKTNKLNIGGTITQKCLISLKSMKNFGVKFFICSSTNEYNKRSITINSHIGTLNTNFYSVAMEDFCHLKINYDEINTNKSEYRKMPKMNEEIKEEHNLKLATETDSKNVFSRIQQENSWLSYLDEITFDTNMDIKIDTEPISCGICDSTRNPSNVMIKSNPFSSMPVWPGAAFPHFQVPPFAFRQHYVIN